MKVYLDTCAWNRLFDLPNNAKVRLEADSVLEILGLAQNDNIDLIWSSVLEYEVKNNSNTEIVSAILSLSKICKSKLKMNEEVNIVSKDLMSKGFDNYDALHLATAITSNLDYFITTDYKVMKLAKKLELTLKIINPIDFIIKDI